MIELIVYQYTGSKVELQVERDDFVFTLLDKMCQKRKDLMLPPTLWLKSLVFFSQGSQLMYDYQTTVEDLRLQDGSVIVEKLML